METILSTIFLPGELGRKDCLFFFFFNFTMENLSIDPDVLKVHTLRTSDLV